MTTWEVPSQIWLPDDIAGRPLRELRIDLTRTRPHVSYDFGPDILQVVGDGNQSFLTPDEFRKVDHPYADMRKVRAVVLVNAVDSQSAISLGTVGTERFLDWLAFLLLDRVVVLHYEPVTSGRSQMPGIATSTIGFRPSFEERNGHRGLVWMSQYRPPRKLDLRSYLERTPSGPLAVALVWYRKGKCAFAPEDQFINWWTGLEVLSAALRIDGNKEVECPHCHAVFPLPAVANTAIREHLQNTLGLRKRVFGRLHGIRSAIVHEGKFVDEPHRAELERYLAGLETLFLTMALRLYNGNDQTGDVPACYRHPVQGSLEYRKIHLESLPI